ncbi:CpsD/CapB family tyrosine-protein kinase [Paenibacillus taiwanensis]|uniref:CpsD/CapB family tyrosine-protein kinase n=1 Tax=Paenibacillus taiwanensis TaxID=401638 RepID=UPI0004914427|nr:CpsD/CapB family tyrosine-protein kinase [Paenibacillus taiwanensis]
MPRHSSKFARTMEYQPLSPIGEMYRSLCTQLQYMQRDDEVWSPSIIGMMSARPGEGKTTTICNLAIAFAIEGKRVLLVDGDLRKPKLHDVFDTGNSKGLSQVLMQRTHPRDAGEETSVRNLTLLSAGKALDDPGKMLASEAFDLLIEEAKAAYDIVLFDAPPVLLFNDAKLIASRCEGVLIVVQSGRTTAKMLNQTRTQLERVNANILGAVLNGAEERWNRSWNQYYSSTR